MANSYNKNGIGVQGFPPDFINPTEKAKMDYCLKASKYIFDSFKNGTDLIGSQRRRDYAENELFSEGNQDNTNYLEGFGLKVNKEGNYESNIDINYEPFGVLRTIVRALMRTLRDVGFNYRIDAVDPISMSEKDTKIAILRAKREMAAQIKAALGMDIVGGKYVPSSEEELQVYSKIGLKNAIEICGEVYLNTVDKLNNYMHDIDKPLNWSLINTDMLGTYIYTDQSGYIKEEAIDMKKLILIGGGEKRDFSDCKAKGYIKRMTLEDVMLLDVDDEIDIEEWDKIAQKICNSMSEKGEDINGLRERDERGVDGAWNYNRFNITLVINCWQTIDTYFKKTMDNPKVKGAKIKRNMPFKQGIKKTKGSERTDVHKYYKSYYIVEAEKIFGYGPMKNMVRESYRKKGKALCPIQVVRVSPSKINRHSSIMDAIKKFDDLATMAWYKLQGEIKAAKPDMYVYNLQAVVNALGELVEADSPDDVIVEGERDGRIYVKTTNNFQESDGGNPVYKVQGGISTAFNDYLNIISMAKQWAHENSGVPIVQTGSQQHQDIGKAVTENMLDGSDRVLDDLAEAKEMLQKNAAIFKFNTILRMTDPSSGLEDPYKDAISGVKKEILSMAGKLSSRDLGLILEKRMSLQEVQDLLLEIRELNAKYTSTGGAEGINTVDYLVLKDMIGDNPKFAHFYLATVIEKRKAEAAEAKMQDSQMNAQAQQQSNEQANLNIQEQKLQDQEMEMMKHKFKLEEIRLQEEEKRKTALLLEDHKIDGKLEVEDLQSKTTLLVADKKIKADRRKQASTQLQQ